MGGFADDEIPLLVMLFYLFRGVEVTVPLAPRLAACDYKQIPFLFPLAVPGGPYRDSSIRIHRL